MRERKTILAFFALATIWVATIFVAYLPGQGSSLHFDDSRNLAGLSIANTPDTALRFVLSGEAGPTGRPLSLATFLPHAAHWPGDLRPFLVVNIVLHLSNGFLVWLLAYLLARTSPAFTAKQRAPWAALAVAGIWLALPLLASSSLFIIQRMTTLAAFFVLLGLVLHVHGRSLFTDRPIAGIVFATLGLLSGLGLGVLSKENAAVYPLLVLVLDRTLLKALPTTSAYRRWRVLFVYVPAALLVAYLLSRLLLGSGFETRHFSMFERVLTQSVILIDYLRLMLVPTSDMLGPFHDNYPLYGGWPPNAALLALVFWGAIGIAAFLFGPRWPIPAFAILWYLLAHSTESTWIPLELYYEHRNYLPAVGVILALVFGLGQIQGRQGRMVYAGFGIYAVALIAVLFQVTSLWGTPRLAAEIWWANNPDSVRAAQYLANEHAREGSPLVAARVLDATSRSDERRLTVQLQSMRLSCVGGDDGRAVELLTQIMDRIPEAYYVNTQPANDSRAVEEILEAISSGACTALAYADVDRIAAAYLENPIVQARRITRHNYYALRARAAGQQGDFDEMMELIVIAIEHSPVLDTVRVAGRMAAESERADWLERILKSLADNRPRNPLLRQEWQELNNKIESWIYELRR